MEKTASSVLDASALLAYLQGEPGSQAVEAELLAGAVVNVVNYAEVLSRLGDVGAEPEFTHRDLCDRGLIGGLVDVVPVTQADAVVIAKLRTITRGRGLSLGDRACVATGLRLGLPVLTADRIWSTLDMGVSVSLIRP
jgi:PIN domain nuclease of toxin-antitoxin system